MRHELKIIMKFQGEDMEHDQTHPVTAATTLVELDGEPVGVIQEINLHVSVEENDPTTLEVVFPDLESNKIDPSYRSGPNLIKTVRASIERMQIIPGIQIKLKEIF